MNCERPNETSIAQYTKDANGPTFVQTSLYKNCPLWIFSPTNIHSSSGSNIGSLCPKKGTLIITTRKSSEKI
jgi:hypothetical protein